MQELLAPCHGHVEEPVLVLNVVFIAPGIGDRRLGYIGPRMILVTLRAGEYPIRQRRYEHHRPFTSLGAMDGADGHRVGRGIGVAAHRLLEQPVAVDAQELRECVEFLRGRQ